MRISQTVIKELKRLVGAQYVRQDELTLRLYAYDCSVSFHRPDAVVTLTKPEQLAPVLSLLSKEKIPFITRAAATNHAGSCTAVRGGVILNLNALRTIYRIDTKQQFAEVDPGVITGQLQQKLHSLGFFYAPDPASEQVSTLGGNLAQNASGARCLKYGNTADNTLQIEWLTPSGQKMTLRHDAPGPDWLGLIAGSEGTLGMIQKMQVRILPQPQSVKTFLVTFSSLEDSIQTVTDLVASGLIPRCIEAMDRVTIQAVEDFTHAGYPQAEALLILELDGNTQQIQTDTKVLQKICKQNHCVSFTAAQSEEEREKLWRGRRAAYAAMAVLAPNVAVGDGTVPRSELPATLKQVRQIIDTYGLSASLLFHAGDGNFHPQLVFDARHQEQTRLVHKALQEILKACVDHGGTVSGEHGIGVEKRAAMTYQYPRQTLQLFKQIKHALDPQLLANPEKIIPIDFASRATTYQSAEPTVQTLQQQVQKHFSQAKPFHIIGSATQLHIADKSVLSTRALDKILDIDKTNYTATVQTGIKVKHVLSVLSKEHVFAKLPADYPGTLGGLVATKTCPQFTSQIIGIEAITPDGELIQYGGKLMKNAAGYNLCRLFTGSWGALGLITQITFKIYATPVKAQLICAQIPAAGPLFQAIKKELDPKNIFLSPAFEQDIA